MAANTIYGRVGENLVRGANVTGFAIRHGMGADQWKPFLSVHLQLIGLIVPIVGVVAVLTGETYLSLVVIGVTINA